MLRAQSLDFQRGGIGPNGRSQYRVASDHRLAHRYELAGIFSTLADRFETTRLALNDIADRYFSIGDANNALEALLKPDPDTQRPE